MSNSPFHNPNSQPLPDANDIAREFNGARLPQTDIPQETLIESDHRLQLEADKRKLRNFVIGLLTIGLVVGALLAIGLVWTLGHFNLLGPQTIEQRE